MKALDRKLLRNLWQMRGQAIAIAAVMGCGVAAFVMALSTLRSLESTRAAYYERYRFADVFAHVKRAPRSLQPRMEAIRGVDRVHPRIVADATLDIAGMTEPAIARLISVPDHDVPPLCTLHLRLGRMPEPGRNNEVLAGEAFATAQGLKLGDEVHAVINGRKQPLTVVGIALSPEYIFSIREGDILPDDKHFGVFWMCETELEAAYDMDGAWNDVLFKLSPDASLPAVMAAVDELLERYGGLGCYEAADQISNRYISSEIQQLEKMSILAPSIFLSVAAFLLNVVMSRVISTQREEIAALKAFGYTKWEVGGHFLKLVLMVTTVGVTGGVLLGIWLGNGMTQMYTKFYHFPHFTFVFDPRVIGWALLISGAAAIAGTVGAVYQAIRLPPAEAMRPEPPARYKKTLLERIGLQRLFSPTARIVLRNLERRIGKAAMSCTGIALAVSVLILGNFTEDAINYMIDIDFRLARRQDMTVTLIEPRSTRALTELAHLPGVERVDAFRQTFVRFRNQQHWKRALLLGLPDDIELFKVVGTDRRDTILPDQGVMLSRKLAEMLDVKPGELVTAEVLEGKRPTLRIPVTGLVEDLSGVWGYMRISELNRLLEEGTIVSGAYLAVDTKYKPVTYAQLKNTPQVASVTIREAMVESFRNTVAENLMRIKTMNVIFAVIIAFGVVYNTARISLAERSRELATLRVIGFTRAEISTVLLGELATLTIVAIPLGLLIGTGMSAAVAAQLDTDMFRVPFVISLSTYSFAVLVVLVASVVSSLLVRRRLDELDLIAVLKTRE
ncbi:outer membrane-specific lipoprotein transporter subunit LolC [Caulifigura coniformis]|uniref:Outer membrane-specific lipoprotein transporter subunit LolC n=1 Tax=Caulifigura coniformis TaxID=2527983 RepID=A0A517SBJ3_9PLAN|nr:FtsX-like permease family protein [Caulifigura coniformis]QDT53507.1 outer membrane-specific lipoprotein transporter subunit LolC [Caulifigura coniformis]